MQYSTVNALDCGENIAYACSTPVFNILLDFLRLSYVSVTFLSSTTWNDFFFVENSGQRGFIL